MTTIVGLANVPVVRVKTQVGATVMVVDSSILALFTSAVATEKLALRVVVSVGGDTTPIIMNMRVLPPLMVDA